MEAMALKSDNSLVCVCVCVCDLGQVILIVSLPQLPHLEREDK